MSFKQIVKIVEAAALAATFVFVVMLFANDGGGGTSAPASTGAALYEAKCQSCHGAEGGGGLGPSLADVTKDYPDIEDQIAFVAAGDGTMPGFEGELTEDELNAVVQYTRTELGG